MSKRRFDSLLQGREEDIQNASSTTRGRYHSLEELRSAHARLFEPGSSFFLNGVLFFCAVCMCIVIIIITTLILVIWVQFLIYVEQCQIRKTVQLEREKRERKVLVAIVAILTSIGDKL